MNQLNKDTLKEINEIIMDFDVPVAKSEALLILILRELRDLRHAVDNFEIPRRW